jgi:hypothetical protein
VWRAYWWSGGSRLLYCVILVRGEGGGLQTSGEMVRTGMEKSEENVDDMGPMSE